VRALGASAARQRHRLGERQGRGALSGAAVTNREDLPKDADCKDGDEDAQGGVVGPVEGAEGRVVATAVGRFHRGILSRTVTAMARPTPPTMRDNDPDLVRAGAHARWEDALAEGALVVGERVVDLDGDGLAERVATVAPRADPAPQNTLSVFVILERRSEGWRASVLFRPAWIGDESARHRTPTATLTLRREWRRHHFVLAVELKNLE